MLAIRVIPCLLKRNSSLVKTVKFGDFQYIGDPVNTIQIFNELEIDELVFLDILATRENKKPDFDLIKKVASECFMPLAYGGGIRSLEEMKKIYNLGVEKLIICTQAIEEPTFIQKATALFGSQSVVVSIDVKKNFWGRYEVYTHSGTKNSKKTPEEIAKLMQKMGAGEILLNSIDNDGMMKGYDLKLVKLIDSAIDLPLIVCGGAGKINDLGKAIRAGASAVAAGSLFVYQKQNRAVLVNFPNEKELKEVLPKGAR